MFEEELPGAGPAGDLYKIGRNGDSDSSELGISTTRGSLRKVCIGSWTMYDLTSQSEHKLYAVGLEGQLRHWYLAPTMVSVHESQL